MHNRFRLAPADLRNHHRERKTLKSKRKTKTYTRNVNSHRRTRESNRRRRPGNEGRAGGTICPSICKQTRAAYPRIRLQRELPISANNRDEKSRHIEKRPKAVYPSGVFPSSCRILPSSNQDSNERHLRVTRILNARNCAALDKRR